MCLSPETTAGKHREGTHRESGVKLWSGVIRHTLGLRAEKGQALLRHETRFWAIDGWMPGKLNPGNGKTDAGPDVR